MIRDIRRGDCVAPIRAVVADAASSGTGRKLRPPRGRGLVPGRGEEEI